MVSQNRKMVIARISGILALLIVTLLSVYALAQEDSGGSGKLLVGVVEAPSGTEQFRFRRFSPDVQHAPYSP
jgi:hypothetical protein